MYCTRRVAIGQLCLVDIPPWGLAVCGPRLWHSVPRACPGMNLPGRRREGVSGILCPSRPAAAGWRCPRGSLRPGRWGVRGDATCDTAPVSCAGAACMAPLPVVLGCAARPLSVGEPLTPSVSRLGLPSECRRGQALPIALHQGWPCSCSCSNTIGSGGPCSQSFIPGQVSLVLALTHVLLQVQPHVGLQPVCASCRRVTA
jgi:hypothetical protein